MRTCSWPPVMCRSAGAVKISRSRLWASSSARGVVGGEQVGEGGFGVVGGHVDRVVDALAFVVEVAGRAGVGEGRAGGGGRGLGFAAGELGAGGERVVGGAGVGGHAGVTGAVVVGSPDAVR